MSHQPETIGSTGEGCHRDVHRYQTPADGIDNKAEAFEGHCARQRGGVPFPEDDERGRVTAIMGKFRTAHAAKGASAVGKECRPFIEGGDPQGFK